MTVTNGIVEERAARILTSNRYLSLAVCDPSGPWCAPVNYVIGPGKRLVFYSAPDSRHGQAVDADSLVAGAIFNSTASSADVDGVQFRARCSALFGTELVQAHTHYFNVNFDDPALRDWFYRDVESFGERGRHRFYALEFEAVYVIDFESMEDSRLDLRVEVPLAQMWNLVGPVT